MSSCSEENGENERSSMWKEESVNEEAMSYVSQG